MRPAVRLGYLVGSSLANQHTGFLGDLPCVENMVDEIETTDRDARKLGDRHWVLADDIAVDAALVCLEKDFADFARVGGIENVCAALLELGEDLQEV